MSRPGGRRPDALRPVRLEPGAAPFAEGSCLASFGVTSVLCTASVMDEVPPWRRGSGEGWVTAEYAMLPRSTQRRTSRERAYPRGRTQEIQRLIGRSLRAAVDLGALGERQIIIDCDVLAADGGTRTAAITGAAVALELACSRLVGEGELARSPMRELVAAVSVGMVDGRVLLDLEYVEDAGADVDLNLVALQTGGLIEVQGTGEAGTFSRDELDEMLDLGEAGIAELLAAQRAALRAAGV
ncbi:MAG TPA: ribonuclease PH [Longimicrobiales bacterium]|nr:ribonuclease PH [Longimicrobiales bacterium]